MFKCKCKVLVLHSDINKLNKNNYFKSLKQRSQSNRVRFKILSGATSQFLIAGGRELEVNLWFNFWGLFFNYHSIGSTFWMSVPFWNVRLEKKNLQFLSTPKVLPFYANSKMMRLARGRFPDRPEFFFDYLRTCFQFWFSSSVNEKSNMIWFHDIKSRFLS